MIISASRRTDIPAFYSKWFINRIRDGYCTVPNPFNSNQVSWVDLSPENVDVIVFWTRNPNPLIPYLPELDKLGYRYYFQYTVLGYPREIDQKSPALNSSKEIFTSLSKKIGAFKMIWRYDPIVFTQNLTPQFHIENFKKISQSLRGSSHHCVISLVDLYTKIKKRINDLNKQGEAIQPPIGIDEDTLKGMLNEMVFWAAKNEMTIHSCAEDIDLTQFGIKPGKCVDDIFIKKVFGIDVSHKKDPSQRKECGCVISKDIGMYDSCLFGCQYCYATSSFDRARLNHSNHNPISPSLIGWHEKEKPNLGQPKIIKQSQQLTLWTDDNTTDN